jgi:RNA polymerase sigma factor (sigma-70 family)
LEEYQRDLASCEIFTKEEEIRLWEKHKAGCKESREKLIKSVLKYVYKIARMRTRRYPLDDMIQELSLSVIEAIDGDWNPHASPLVYYIKRKLSWRVPNIDMRKPSLIKVTGLKRVPLEEKIYYDAEHTDDHQVLKKCKEVLTDKQLKVIELWLNGMTYEEIAKVTNCTKQNVSQTLWNAKRRMKSYYENDLGSNSDLLMDIFG